MEPKILSQASTRLHKKLRELSGVQSECKIYRVHHLLRNVNPKAYEPEVIAIGPYHHGKDHLKMMEEQKLCFLQQLLVKKKNPNIVETYVKALGALEEKSRRCYADQPKTLTKDEFIQMLVLDGCFIVQLVRKFAQGELNDPIFQMGWMMIGLQRDLMLFENQLPFFVLYELYDLIGQVRSRCSNLPLTLCDLLFVFFKGYGLYTGADHILRPIEDPCHQVKHLLDFIHRSLLPPHNVPRSDSSEGRFINNARRLKEANVKFGKSEGKTFDIKFEKGKIMMAPLTIDDGTESFLRNLIAYEQYFHHSAVTDYVRFLDRIIDSSKDVEILSQSGIIKNWLGDENNVAEMVNKLRDGVCCPPYKFKYEDMFKKVNDHCERSRNKWMAKLRHNYFNSPWAVISVLVALVLLLLTVTQTVFGILQVV